MRLMDDNGEQFFWTTPTLDKGRSSSPTDATNPER